METYRLFSKRVKGHFDLRFFVQVTTLCHHHHLSFFEINNVGTSEKKTGPSVELKALKLNPPEAFFLNTRHS